MIEQHEYDMEAWYAGRKRKKNRRTAWLIVPTHEGVPENGRVHAFSSNEKQIDVWLRYCDWFFKGDFRRAEERWYVTRAKMM